MTAADDSHGAIASLRAVWQHRRWRWLLGSEVVSLAGDFLYWVALVVYLADGDDGPAWIAAALIARFVPYVVLGPIGGAIADRFDRRRTLVALDLTRGAVFVAMAAVVASGGSRVAVIALLVLGATAGAFYNPAKIAATPIVVPERDIAAANAVQQGLSQLAWFVGPALGALLVTVVEPAVVLVIDAMTFIAAAVMVARAGSLGGGKATTAESGPDDASNRPGIVGDIREGIRTVARDRGLVSMTALTVAILFAFGAEQVLYVFVATDRLDLGPEGIGYLLAAMGIGGIVATPISVRLSNSARLGWWLAAASIAVCLPLVLISFVSSRPLAYGLTAFEGAGAIVFEVASLTLLQRAVSESMLGRVYALQDTLGALGQTIGSIAAPALVVSIGLESALRASGLVAIVIVVVSAPGLVGLARAVDDRRRALAATVERLATTDELGAFDRPALERLARAATEIVVTAGDDVVIEGERADHLYVVVSGSLGVTVAAGSPAEAPPDLGPGDVFGEIGLLRDGVRSATVTALVDVTLLRIDGSVFVDVATPGVASTSALFGGMQQRLARTHPHPSPARAETV